jgi:hypothetical protein
MGAKVTLSEGVPAPGVVFGVAHAKVPLTIIPFTEAEPPLNVEAASV